LKPIFIYGSSAVDVTAYSDGDVQLSPGGKASNQAIAALTYGAEDVRLATLITSDPMGHYLVNFWREKGLPDKNVQRLHASNGHPTSITSITLTDDGTPKFVRGDNVGKYPDEVHKERWLKAIPENGIFITQFSADIQTSLKLAIKAKELGNTVIVDPAPAADVPEEFWSNVDIATPNSDEARYYHKLPVPLTIETLGKHGVAVNKTHVPGIPVDTVDTTGAGDAFVGALAAKLAASWKFEEAVKYANCAGALSTTRKGAAVSFASKAEVDELYDNIYIKGLVPEKTKSAVKAEAGKGAWIIKSDDAGASEPKRRGRPKKNAPKIEVVPAEPKKRGRPKKTAVAPLIEEAEEIAEVAESTIAETEIAETLTDVAIEEANEIAAIDDVAEVNETVEAAPVDVAEEIAEPEEISEIAIEEPSEVPKKRGRPKKAKSAEKEKRGRGRPKKSV
jgi:ribokinase